MSLHAFEAARIAVLPRFVRAHPLEAMERMLSDVIAAAGLATDCASPSVQHNSAAAAVSGVPDARLEIVVALSSVFSAPALALLLRQPESTRESEVLRLGRLVLGEPHKLHDSIASRTALKHCTCRG